MRGYHVECPVQLIMPLTRGNVASPYVREVLEFTTSLQNLVYCAVSLTCTNVGKLLTIAELKRGYHSTVVYVMLFSIWFS